MSLYVVTVPVTVETYARNPREAVEQAQRAIRTNTEIAARHHTQPGKARVSLWRPWRWTPRQNANPGTRG